MNDGISEKLSKQVITHPVIFDYKVTKDTNKAISKK